MNATLVVEKSGSILVSIPFDGETGTAYFCFEEVEQFNSRELSSVLQIDIYQVGGGPVRMTNRINLLSASAKDDFIRSLKRLLRNDSLPIESAFIQSIELLKEHLATQIDVEWVEDVKAEHARMLFNPFLVEGAPSVLFGKGGGAKTYLALRMGFSLVSGMPFMGFTPSHKCKVLFVDYEDTAGNFAARREHLFMGEHALSSVDTEKMFCRLSPRGVPLVDLLPKIKKIIKENDIGFLIVDSAVSACGGEPEKADVVAKYFNALASLGITNLTIAHETKSENHAYPFGSVFWYNFPRSIWNVRSVRDDSDETNLASSAIETGLFHRKANNGPLYPPIPLQIVFKSQGEILESVTIRRGDENQWEDEKSIPSRIRTILAKGMKTRLEMAEHMPDIHPKMIDKELLRLRERGLIELLGTKGSPYILAKKLPQNI